MHFLFLHWIALNKRFSSVFFCTRYDSTGEILFSAFFKHSRYNLHACQTTVFHLAIRICRANFEREISKNTMGLYTVSIILLLVPLNWTTLSRDRIIASNAPVYANWIFHHLSDFIRLRHENVISKMCHYSSEIDFRWTLFWFVVGLLGCYTDRD